MYLLMVRTCTCMHVHVFIFYYLKHKDGFGKSENLSKTFYAEILVFHPDYECKSPSSNCHL